MAAITSQQGDHVALLQVGDAGHVQHQLIHGDGPDLLGQVALDDHLEPVRKNPGYPVGIANADHGQPNGAIAHILVAVANACASGHGLEVGNASFDLDDGLKFYLGLQMGSWVDAVEAQAHAHQVIVQSWISQGSSGIGQV